VRRWLLRRLGAAVLLLAVISVLSFCLLEFAPGDPVQILLAGSTRTPSPATVEALRAEYHLDDTLLSRYVNWARDAAELDLGRSMRTKEGVLTGIVRRTTLTLQLAGLSFALVVIVGVPLGVMAALRRGKALDRTIVGASVFAVSAPPFATGILLLSLFAVAVPWFPAFGPGDSGLDRLHHLVLPAVALALTAVAIVVRVTRAAMVREMDQDYVVFAAARGISRRRIVWRYAFRNALIPVVTASGVVLSYMVGGAVLVEIAFSLPGVGSLLVESANSKDVPMLQGLVLTLGAFVLILNLVVDATYAVLDPRVRLGASGNG
jgi:peptide/nickel transport system permease protein